jgi:hypothetical protein
VPLEKLQQHERCFGCWLLPASEAIRDCLRSHTGDLGNPNAATVLLVAPSPEIFDQSKKMPDQSSRSSIRHQVFRRHPPL